MTKLNDVVQRAISDAAFRSQLRSDPAKALRGFSLSPEETRALTSGDPAKLVALGIDQRMSKVFIAAGETGAPFDAHYAGDVGISHAALTSTGGRLASGQTANFGDPNAILISGRDERDALAGPHYQTDPDYRASSGDATSAALLSSGDEVHAAAQTRLNVMSGEDKLIMGGDESAHAALQPNRFHGGDRDFVAPTSGQVDSGATIDAGSVDSASLQTGENQIDTGAQTDGGDAPQDTIIPQGDHSTDY